MGAFRRPPPGVGPEFRESVPKRFIGHHVIGPNDVFLAFAAAHLQFFGIRGMGRGTTLMGKGPGADQRHSGDVQRLAGNRLGAARRPPVDADRVAAVVVGVVGDVRHQIPARDLPETRPVPRVIQNHGIMEGAPAAVRIRPADAVGGQALGPSGAVVVIDHMVVRVASGKLERISRIEPHHRIPVVPEQAPGEGIRPMGVVGRDLHADALHGACRDQTVARAFQAGPGIDPEQQARTRMKQQVSVRRVSGKHMIRGFELRGHSRRVHAAVERGLENRMQFAADPPVPLVVCGVGVFRRQVSLIVESGEQPRLPVLIAGLDECLAKGAAGIVRRHPPAADGCGGRACKQGNRPGTAVSPNHMAGIVSFVFR